VGGRHYSGASTVLQRAIEVRPGIVYAEIYRRRESLVPP